MIFNCDLEFYNEGSLVPMGNHIVAAIGTIYGWH